MRLWLLPQAIGHPKGAKSPKKKASKRTRGFLIELGDLLPKMLKNQCFITNLRCFCDFSVP
jgi:hypothetical protein